MHKLCFCFKCGKCSCIVCEETPIQTPITSIHQTLEEKLTSCIEICAKVANMDVHSHAPFVASSSSIRSTPIVESHPTLEDIKIAYQKLQSLISNPLVKFAIPNGTSAKYPSTFHQVPHKSIIGGYERQSSSGPYCTPNKIAYKGPSSTRSSTQALSNSHDGPCLATLQDLIRKMSIKKTPPMTQECSVVDESTERLMNKLKNLDEILQNLDNSLLCRNSSPKLFAPQMEKNRSISSSKSSDESFVGSKQANLSNMKLLSTEGELTFATPTHSSTIWGNLDLNEKTPIHLRRETNLHVDKSCLESRSSESTQVLQSFATPIITREAQDTPFLLSKFASFGNATKGKISNEEKTMKEVVEMIAMQVGQQLLQRIQCLQRRPWRRQQKRCKMAFDKKPTTKFWKQVLSSFQQRMARSDETLEVVKNQLNQVLKETNYKSMISSIEKDSRDEQGNIQSMESIKESTSLCRIVKTLEEKYSTLSNNSQQVGVGIERVEKQCREHSTELELCWAAINQLCIDNELFRNELLQQRGSSENK